MTAQGISACGQDRNGLEAKPASPVAESHAPNFGLGITIPHNPLSVQLSKAVIIGWGILAWLPLVVLIAAYLVLA